MSTGALAHALEDLASAETPPDARAALASRLLALLAALPLERGLAAIARDACALVPAVAAAADTALVSGAAPSGALTACPSSPVAIPAVSVGLGSPQRSGRLPQSVNSSEVPAASAAPLLLSDGATVKRFRNAWLVCALLGLHRMPPPAIDPTADDSRVSRALGRLAAATPILMYGTGVAKEREAERRVALELAPLLSAAGPAGAPAAVAEALSATLLNPPKLSKSNPNNAFLLAIASLETCRAGVAPLPTTHSPITHTLAYAATAPAKTQDAAVYLSLIHI